MSQDPRTGSTSDSQTPDSDTPAVEQLSYEQARAELAAVVNRLEAGEVPLAESLRLWERGEALAAHCEHWLDRAQHRLDQAVAGAPAPTADPRRPDNP